MADGEFVHRWFEANENVARFESFVVIDRVKVGLSIPVQIDEAVSASGSRHQRQNKEGR